jgi:hypothetical protein
MQMEWPISKRRILFLVLVFCISASALFSWVDPFSPRFQGRTIGQWAASADRNGRVPVAIVKHFGTNAAPFLANELKWVHPPKRLIKQWSWLRDKLGKEKAAKGAYFWASILVRDDPHGLEAIVMTFSMTDLEWFLSTRSYDDIDTGLRNVEWWSVSPNARKKAKVMREIFVANGRIPP